MMWKPVRRRIGVSILRDDSLGEKKDWPLVRQLGGISPGRSAAQCFLAAARPNVSWPQRGSMFIANAATKRLQLRRSEMLITWRDISLLWSFEEMLIRQL